MQCEVSFARRNRVFQKSHLRTGARTLCLGMGFGLCESVGRTNRGHCAYRMIKVQEADGVSSRQERVRLVITTHGGE